MQIHGSERERRELNALLWEVFKAGQYGTDQMLMAEENFRAGKAEDFRLNLLTSASCQQKILELVKRLIMGFRLDDESMNDLYLGPDEKPMPGQPCALSNLKKQ